MTTAAEQVAIVEGEAAQAVSAAVIAEQAAQSAVASATALADQLVANNAATVREWSDDLERNKENFEWIKSDLTEMRSTLATVTTTQESQAVEILRLSTLLAPPIVEPATPSPSPQPQPNADAVDLQAAVPAPSPQPPAPPPPKRFKRL